MNTTRYVIVWIIATGCALYLGAALGTALRPFVQRFRRR